MPVKAIVDSLEDVPEAIRDEYEETEDGSFKLRLEGAETEDDISGLKNALDREREERRKAKKRLQELESQYGEVDVEEYRTLREQAEERERKKAEEKGEWEKLRAKLQEKYETQLQEKDQEVESREQFIRRLLIDNQLSDAIAQAGVADQYRDAVKALLLQRGPKVVREDGEYRAVFETDLEGATDLSEYVSEWAQSEQAAAFIKSGATGSGATGGSRGGATGGKRWKSRADMSDADKAAFLADLREKGITGKDAIAEFMKIPATSE